MTKPVPVTPDGSGHSNRGRRQNTSSNDVPQVTPDSQHHHSGLNNQSQMPVAPNNPPALTSGQGRNLTTNLFASISSLTSSSSVTSHLSTRKRRRNNQSLGSFALGNIDGNVSYPFLNLRVPTSGSSLFGLNSSHGSIPNAPSGNQSFNFDSDDEENIRPQTPPPISSSFFSSIASNEEESATSSSEDDDNSIANDGYTTPPPSIPTAPPELRRNSKPNIDRGM